MISATDLSILKKMTDVVGGNTPKNVGDNNEQQGGGQRRARAGEESDR